jgi:activator of HSP90 ATPase
MDVKPGEKAMSNTVIHSVTFKGVSPKQLYDTYLDSKKHGDAINDKASIVPKVGGSFSAFGMIKGKFVLLVKDKMIVQTWRSVKFTKKDGDSILVLKFEKTSKGGRIDMTHTNIPNSDLKGIQQGWPQYYWKPWTNYFRRNS